MRRSRFAIIGAGFWARYQLAAWRELPEAECVAVCDCHIERAQALAREFSIAAVYDDPTKVMEEVRPDFLDLVTNADSHRDLVLLAARHRLPVICQKPMATDFRSAMEMVESCRHANVPFLVHENWRWQRPIRELKEMLDAGEIGRPFRARIDYCNSFPVFANQPFLKQLERFILTDMGSHILDVARFLFGESSRLMCETARVHDEIAGEDVATILLRTGDGVIISCNLSYASRLERDCFPETLMVVEGNNGSIELAPDCWVRATTAAGTSARHVPPLDYEWADARYALVHASIVDCHRNLLHALRSGSRAETDASDNLRTMELVFAAYLAAEEHRCVDFSRESLLLDTR